MHTYDTTDMTCKRIGQDKYLMEENGIKYIFEVLDLYDDIWIEITREDGKEITQEEKEKVEQRYYER